MSTTLSHNNSAPRGKFSHYNKSVLATLKGNVVLLTDVVSFATSVTHEMIEAFKVVRLMVFLAHFL